MLVWVNVDLFVMCVLLVDGVCDVEWFWLVCELYDVVGYKFMVMWLNLCVLVIELLLVYCELLLLVECLFGELFGDIC